MATVDIWFRVRNPHELLVHEVTQLSGLYESRGISVRLRDGTGRSIDSLSTTFGLGDLLLTSREPGAWTVSLVYTDRPLFWIYAFESLEQLRLRNPVRFLLHPAGTAPFGLGSLACARLGIRLEVDGCGEEVNDHLKAEALASGDWQGAIFGSSIAPSVLARMGLKGIACVGDVVSFPTTGVATRLASDSTRDFTSAQLEAWSGVSGEQGAAALKNLVSVDEDQAYELFKTEYEHRISVQIPTFSPAALATQAHSVDAAVSFYERHGDR